MKIFIDPKTLSDGSLVYAVRLTRFEDMPRSIDTLVFDAVTYDDARSMAFMVADAINEHTTEIAAVQNAERP